MAVWRAPAQALAGLRHAAWVLPAEARIAPGRWVRLDAWALPASGRRVLLHAGALDGDGWAVAFEGARLVVRPRCDGAVGWRSRTLAPGWHRVEVAFGPDADGALEPAVRPVAVRVDGRALAPATLTPIEAVPGDRAEVAGAVLGGARDRAGGHANLRYGERPGELVARCEVRDRPVAVAARPAVVRGARVVVRRVGDGHEGRVQGAPRGARVLWDLGDRVQVGARTRWPEAWVRRPVAVHLSTPGGAVRLRGPRTSGHVAVPVFRPGEGGYAAFRIPALVRAADGALLAFAEGRLESVSDSCRTKHLVLRRSEDEGRTWGPLTVAAALPEGPGVRSLMNPSPVVDAVRGTGRVVLVHSALDADEWSIAAGRGRAALRAVASEDHGRTWGEPVDVAAQLGLPEGVEAAWPDPQGWRVQVGTLGHGVQLRHGPHPGRLCFAGHGTFGPGSVFDGVGFLFWSDDLGRTWQVGPAFATRDDGTPARGVNESALAELPDGRLVVHARHYRDGRPVGWRAVARVAWGADGRARVGPVRTERQLVDSGVQAGLLATPPTAAAPAGGLWCSFPAHPTARVALTLRGSLDGGATWPLERLLVAGRVGYSDLVALPDGIGVLYEDGADGALSFVAVPDA
jgi:sialidase-1